MRIVVRYELDSTDYGDYDGRKPGLLAGMGQINHPSFEEMYAAPDSENLPPGLREIYRTPGLHDGLLRQITYRGADLELVLRCGFIDMGYYDAMFIYQNAVVHDQDVMHDLHNRTSWRGGADLMTFEFQPIGDRLVHTFVFDGTEIGQLTTFAIEADDIQFSTKAAKSRRFNWHPVRYVKTGSG